MGARSNKQAKAAQLEYIRRTIEKKPPQKKTEKKKRPFGTATTDQLKNFLSVG